MEDPVKYEDLEPGTLARFKSDFSALLTDVIASAVENKAFVTAEFAIRVDGRDPLASEG